MATDDREEPDEPNEEEPTIPPEVAEQIAAQFVPVFRQLDALSKSPGIKMAQQLAETWRFQEQALRNAQVVAGLAEQFRPVAINLGINAEIARNLAKLSPLADTVREIGRLAASSAFEARMAEVANAVAAASQLTLKVSPPPIFTAYSNMAAQGWQQALDAALITPPPRPERLVLLGESALGVIETGNELGLTEDEEAAPPKPERWRDGQIQMMDELSAWLTTVYPPAVTKLKGAWHTLTSNGPDAASQAANSGVEALDWTLRMIAPDKEVLAWRQEVGLYADEVDGQNGKPHRRLRVRYIIRDYGLDSNSVTIVTTMVTATLKQLQGVKHGPEDDRAIAATQQALIALEYTFQLLMPR
ncbi:hypothetical protein [Frankia sp. CiP3]|uniref:pPIWI-associating nuclease domain-containing protein n=1 Tax=Frankia sp. CiP3 TaxID=2880971 RepID=UPI001EF6126E|nr:hypothetical protein [Frankia sp. CiP3]